MYFRERHEVHKEKDVGVGCHIALSCVNSQVVMEEALAYKRVMAVGCDGEENV